MRLPDSLALVFAPNRARGVFNEDQAMASSDVAKLSEPTGKSNLMYRQDSSRTRRDRRLDAGRIEVISS